MEGKLRQAICDPGCTIISAAWLQEWMSVAGVKHLDLCLSIQVRCYELFYCRPFTDSYLKSAGESVFYPPCGRTSRRQTLFGSQLNNPQSLFLTGAAARRIHERLNRDWPQTSVTTGEAIISKFQRLLCLGGRQPQKKTREKEIRERERVMSEGRRRWRGS